MVGVGNLDTVQRTALHEDEVPHTLDPRLRALGPGDSLCVTDGPQCKTQDRGR